MSKNNILCSGSFKPENDYLWVVWSLNDSCNYKCRYCFIKDRGFASKETIDQTISFLRNAPQERKDVLLFGGEPTINPYFLYIVDELNKFCTMVQVFTNLSASEEFLSQCIERNIIFNITYHADVINPQEFLSKLDFLRKNKASINFVNLMMLDDKRADNEVVAAFCRFNKITHKYLPISGGNEKNYWIESLKYSKRDDVKSLRDIVVVKEDKTHNLTEIEYMVLNFFDYKGFYCYAGMRSMWITHRGDVYRCYNDKEQGIKFCTVYDEYPELAYYVCPYTRCTCEYFVPKERDLGLANKLLGETTNEMRTNTTLKNME